MKNTSAGTVRFNDVGVRKRLLAALAIGTVAGPVALGLVQTPPLAGQILQATGPLPSFEVASIRPDPSPSGPHWTKIGYAGHGAPMDRFIMTNTSIKDLICLAFGGKPCHMLPDGEVSGGPGWINSERYDIDAKVKDEQVAALYKLSGSDQALQIQLMVQSLLADRFKLVVNEATVTRPAYALVIAKGGPKLQESIPGSPSPIELQGNPVDFLTEPGEIRAHGIPISKLAMQLSMERAAVGRPVLDQTGLKGKYDFDLTWTPPPGMGPGPSSGAEMAPPPDTSGSSIFTALQEQLGLKLEPAKGPMEVLQIVHIEKPSEN